MGVLTGPRNNPTEVEDLCIQVNNYHRRICFSLIRTDEEVERLHEIIGLLTETPGFYGRLSTGENLLYFARFYDIDADSQVDKEDGLMGKKE
ncbi:MAG: hypothetical protein OCU22_07570 [Canidatus Methanoxibalbensis ujae]|nr:hypothetical protein [Candidatus Methanoxibalbensis ujae]